MRTLPIDLPRSSFRRLSPVAILCGLAALVLLAAVLYLVPTYAPFGLAVLGIGVPLVLLVWFRPEFGLLAVVFLAASMVPPELVDLRLPIGGLELRDLALIGMLGLLILRGLVYHSLVLPWRPVGAPLLVFLGLAAFSTVYALFFQNVESNWAFSEFRALFFYSVFFVAGWSIRSSRQLPIVLIGLFLCADFIAGVLILQQSLGMNHPLLAAMSSSNWRLYDMGQTGAAGSFGMVRIMPPGVTLPYFMMIVALCLIVFTARRRWLRVVLALQFVFLNVGLLLTYTRAMWVAAVCALGLVSVALLLEYRAYLFRVVAIGVAVILLLLGLLGTGIFGNEGSSIVTGPLAERFLSILRPGDVLESNSLEARAFENEQALRSVSQNPLLGVGLGNSYRKITTLQGEASGYRAGSGLEAERISRFTRFLHNSYLYIPVKMGLTGLACFLWFCVALLIQSVRSYRQLDDGRSRAIVLAVLSGFVGLMVWSVFHQHFMQAESAGTIGLVAGLVASVRRIHGLVPASQVAE